MRPSASTPPPRLGCGHGQDHGDLILDVRVAVPAPDGWTARDTGRVRRVLDA